MIPALPALAALAQKLIIGKVLAETRSAAVKVVAKHAIQGVGVKLKGKKTYIGIIVLLASFFAPQLGLTEGEVSEIVTQLTAAAGGLMALYGRWDASR